LPTRPTKTSDSRSRNFGEYRSSLTRSTLIGCERSWSWRFADHLPEQQLNVLKAAEQSERDLIKALVRR
jgi:hypothetical protein